MTPERKLILVVDDTPLNISVITGALKDTYRTKVATSGAKALAITAADEKPDEKPAAAPLERKALDEAVYKVLRDVINHGADLYNINQDYAGCYRLY